MSTNIGINGFGRVGRQVLRTILQYYPDKLQVVAVNDLYDPATNAHLFKYDSNYGKYPGTVHVKGNNLVVDGKGIRVFAERDPSQLPWGDLDVQIVVESTGIFREGPLAAAHLEGGAKKVIISAPAKQEDVTVVMGVNEDWYDAQKHHIVSNASCTTNCLAPVAKIVNDRFGIVKGFMTTVHAYTSGQRLLDMGHKDLRRARAAAMSIVPTTTGAARAIGVVIPELEGKLDAFSIRVPISTVSLIDLTAEVERSTSTAELLKAFKEAAEGPLKGIMGYSEEPLVSIDYKGDPRSSIIDAQFTQVMLGNMVRVISWYDNEWAYSVRLADLANYIAERL
ncbi:MAG: type I glyceraldehyde-3-phosphate dehydrogenase [Chloroflexi bacterium B3_Chlor]|nr:MAG: type I glyceraldehyde-3-phosphate dehydrogenase [Chloroflexi bacterium B3_Chlor]